MQDRPAWTPLFVLCVFMLAANVGVVPLMDVFNQRDWGALWVYTCFGVICAEGGVLSVGLVWGSGLLLIRLVLHWAAAMVLFLAWLAGAVIVEGLRESTRDATAIGFFSLPLVALAIQLPLWAMRAFLGWRLTFRQDFESRNADPPLAIRDLMAATLMVAVALTFARIVQTFNSHERNYWQIWAVVAASAAGTSTVSLLPVAWWMFRWPQGAGGVLLAVLYAFVAAVITNTVVSFIERSARLWDMIGMSTTLVAFGMTLALAGYAAWRAGYRLHIGRG